MVKTAIKRTVASIVCLAMALTICACGNEDKGPDYADDEAMQVIASGLEKRFEIADREATTSSEQLARAKDAIQAELDTDTPLKNRQFKNSKLQEQVISYINVLNEQKDVTKDYEYQSAEYTKQWGKAYDKRTQILKTFVDEYGLKLSGEDQEVLDKLVAEGAEAAKTSDEKETINKLINEAKFEKTDDGYGFYTYKAVVENTSNLTFTNVSVTLDLLDDAGVKHEEYTSIGNWAPGEKVELKTSSDINAKEIKQHVTFYDVED